MKITVLGATGRTGRHVVRQALERGHTVTAVVRDASKLEPATGLTVVTADVHDGPAIAAALRGAEVIVSTLGVAKGEKGGTLELGARAATAAKPTRLIWMGAFGTGPSAGPAGGFTRLMLKLAMGSELPDKVAADAGVLAAGGTVLHCGLLGDGEASPTRRLVPLAEAPTGWPKKVNAATVAAAMLDVVEAPSAKPGVFAPLES